jgi:hypothetical protein
MDGLEKIDAVLGEVDISADARDLLSAVRNQLMKQPPARLRDIGVESGDRFVSLTFVHKDGAELVISDGDGYTAIVGGEVDFHGYIDTEDLIEVVTALLGSGVTYVRHARLGYKVADYFDVTGVELGRLGRGSYGIAGLPGALLGALPLLPEQVRHIRIRFDQAPALSLA